MSATATEPKASGLELAQTLEQARLACASGALSESERLYRQALVLAPRHVEAWSELATVLQALGQDRNAEEARRNAGESAIDAAASMAASLLGTPLEARAPGILQKALQAHPDIAAGPLAQSELLRRMGDLTGALAAARRCLELDPANARAAWLAASLQGRREAPNPRFVSPAPLWVIDDFLPAELHEEMLRYGLGHREALEPSSTGGLRRRENWRRSHVDRAPPFGERVLPVICRVAEQAVERLGLEPFEIISRDIQFTAHNDGDYYRVHRDWTPEDTGHRRLTFVYYLHRQPLGFDGGGLRMFDTSEDGGQYFDQAYSKVLPRDNRIVFFPSYVWHEVEKVTCRSGLYEDSRFTLNGWLGVADERA